MTLLTRVQTIPCMKKTPKPPSGFTRDPRTTFNACRLCRFSQDSAYFALFVTTESSHLVAVLAPLAADRTP